MRIHLLKASSDFSEIREIDGLSDLLAIMKEFRCDIILSDDIFDRNAEAAGVEMEVKIYDGYIE